jgi:hypothetical protein
MDWPEAIEVVIARTKHERYRELCDDTHPDHPAWRRRIIALATGEPESLPLSLRQDNSLPTVSEAWDLTRAMRACPFWSRRPGCCTGANCALRSGAVVSHVDCFACLKIYG